MRKIVNVFSYDVISMIWRHILQKKKTKKKKKKKKKNTSKYVLMILNMNCHNPQVHCWSRQSCKSPDFQPSRSCLTWVDSDYHKPIDAVRPPTPTTGYGIFSLAWRLPIGWRCYPMKNVSRIVSQVPSSHCSDRYLRCPGNC